MSVRGPGHAFADAPAVVGAHEVVVVVPQGVNPIGGVVGLQHQHGVDIRAHVGAVPGLSMAMTKLDMPVVGRPHVLVQLRHHLGECVGAREASELSVIDVDLVGPAAAEQRPVLGIDSGGVADQHLGDLLFVGIHTPRPIREVRLRSTLVRRLGSTISLWRHEQMLTKVSGGPHSSRPDHM